MLPPFRSLDAVEIACPCGGATPKQPIIGASGSVQPASAGSGRSSRTRARFAVDKPFDAVAWRQLARCLGVDDVRRQRAPGPAGVAHRLDLQDLDLQSIPRLGTLDEYRAVHRIRRARLLLAAPVHPGRIERFGHHGVATGHPEHRRHRHQHIRPGLRFKAVCFGHGRD
jgi:hypothetical protein